MGDFGLRDFEPLLDLETLLDFEPLPLFREAFDGLRLPDLERAVEETKFSGKF